LANEPPRPSRNDGYRSAPPILRATRYWQRRYWEHTIRDVDDFACHADYTHFSPIKHRHVTRVADWPFSSFPRMVPLGIYPENWAGGPDSSEARFGQG
jgi:putative transposase